MRIFVLFSVLVGTVALLACVSCTATGRMETAIASRPPTNQAPLLLTPEPTAATYVIVDTSIMYVRNGPGMGFNVISKIESQKRYVVIGKHADWWLLDLGNNRSGWIHASVNKTKFFGNMNTVPNLESPPTPTSEMIPACTSADNTETSSEGIKKARNTLVSFFNLLNHQEYKKAIAFYGGDYQSLRDSNPLVDPQDYAALLKNGCEINGLECLQIKRIVAEKAVSVAEYHFTVEFANEDGSLFVLGPCCGGNATDMPPRSQFDYRVIRDCAGKFLVLELPVAAP